MKLKVIYSDRYFQDWPSWHLIYEWEDIISKTLRLKVTNSRRAAVTTFFTDKFVRYLSRKVYGNSRLLILADRFISKPVGLYFDLLPRSSFYFTGSKNTIPVIIDFWKSTDLNVFYNAYNNCRVVLISSIEVHNYLKDNKCPLNIRHFPLSLPDQYKIRSYSTVEKKYDIIIPGRGNPVMWQYLQTYEHKFPGIEYLYQKGIGGELYYISNIRGVVGKFHDREEYINLLKASQVAFYSTPGIDGDEKRTGGFSPVTPRFLEMISAGCHIIARYPKNAETEYYEMNKIAVSANNYPLFEEQLSKALSGKAPDLNAMEKYLAPHYTSEKIALLVDILNQTN